MKAAALLRNLLRFVAASVLVLVFGISCQKSNDDNACPHNSNNTDQSTTRGMEVGGDAGKPDPTGEPVGGQIRSGQVFDTGEGDDGGISDDGDDEADKESSNRPRPGH
jgi:hypothetical protein